jgi:hypothetical protein
MSESERFDVERVERERGIGMLMAVGYTAATWAFIYMLGWPANAGMLTGTTLLGIVRVIPRRYRRRWTFDA